MNDNLRYYDALRSVPGHALRRIRAGRLKGKSDISPQWRYEAMTKIFGPCGIGWKFSIDRKWTEPGDKGQVFAFVDISVHIKVDGDWSEPIPGTGGSMLVVSEKSGLYCNNEAWKMATTDALSTSLKMLGVAADVYSGLSDSKHGPAGDNNFNQRLQGDFHGSNQSFQKNHQQPSQPFPEIDTRQHKNLEARISELSKRFGVDPRECRKRVKMFAEKAEIKNLGIHHGHLNKIHPETHRRIMIELEDLVALMAEEKLDSTMR